MILPVSTDEAEAGVKKNGIRGFDVLRRQMHQSPGDICKRTTGKLNGHTDMTDHDDECELGELTPEWWI